MAAEEDNAAAAAAAAEAAEAEAVVAAPTTYLSPELKLSVAERTTQVQRSFSAKALIPSPSSGAGAAGAAAGAAREAKAGRQARAKDDHDAVADAAATNEASAQPIFSRLFGKVFRGSGSSVGGGGGGGGGSGGGGRAGMGEGAGKPRAASHQVPGSAATLLMHEGMQKNRGQRATTDVSGGGAGKRKSPRSGAGKDGSARFAAAFGGGAAAATGGDGKAAESAGGNRDVVEVDEDISASVLVTPAEERELASLDGTTLHIAVEEMVDPSHDADKLFRGIEFGQWSRRGYQEHANEDRVLAMEDVFTKVTGQPLLAQPKTSLFGVFDGHGGTEAAEMLQKRVPRLVVESDIWNDLDATAEDCAERVLSQAMDTVEHMLKVLYNDHRESSGACATLAIFRAGRLSVANVGDCQAILCSEYGKIIRLSANHRCNNPLEVQRLNAVGAQIINDRVLGSLEPTRTIGDYDIKSIKADSVIALPHRRSIILRKHRDVDTLGVGPMKPGAAVPPAASATASPNSSREELLRSESLMQGAAAPPTSSPSQKTRLRLPAFLVIASDGVWDVLSTSKVASIVRSKLRKHMGAEEIARALVDRAMHAGSADDTSAVFVRFVE